MKNFVIAIVLLLMGSCAMPYQIYSDYERDINFQKYQTFQLVKQDHNFPMGASPIHVQRIDRAIVKELTGLGFKINDKPDLLISWFVKVDIVSNVNLYRDYYDRWKGRDWLDNNYYKKGTFIVDIIERETNQIIWHGSVSDHVYENMPRVEDKINAATEAMFKKFVMDAQIQEVVAIK